MTVAAASVLPRAAISDADVAPPAAVGTFSSLARQCFSTPANAVVTIAGLAGLGAALVLLLRYALIDAVFVADDPAVCRSAAGACWAVVSRHARVIFLGLYPREEQWRAAASLVLIAAVAVAAGIPALQRPRRLLLLVAVSWSGLILLMRGGLFGLSVVPSDRWSGLPLTVHCFLSTVALGFPLAVLLALGRVSRLPTIRWTASVLVETVRAIPLLTILFCAAVVAPLAVPGFLSPDKMNRIILGLALFYACYQAEVVRGGIEAVRPSEIEGATALGFRSWQTMLLIVLPQALRFTIPASVNLLVVALKDTALIVIVGLFDFLAAANTSIASDAWSPFFGEVYAVVALTYLAMTGALSKFGRIAERRLSILR